MMGTKTIALSDDAYRRLARLKKKGESFTDVVQRLTGRQGLSRFIGCVSPEFANELEARIREFRTEFDRNARERLDRVFGSR